MSDKERYQAFDPASDWDWCDDLRLADGSKLRRGMSMTLYADGHVEVHHPATQPDGTPTALKSERVPSNGG